MTVPERRNTHEHHCTMALRVQWVGWPRHCLECLVAEQQEDPEGKFTLVTPLAPASPRHPKRCLGHLALSSSREKNLVRLRRGLSGLIVWPLDRCASEFYGEIAADLRRRGRPMQVIDMLLAAVARSLGDWTVVTTDSDLWAIPGLSVENGDVTRPS